MLGSAAHDTCMSSKPQPSALDVERRRQLIFILNELVVDPTNLQVVSDFNPSADAPYHSAQHLISTAVRAYAGGFLEGLTRRERAVLVVAALWHDFDHTGGPSPDRINIERAVAGYVAGAFPGDQKFVDAVVRAIRATEDGGPGPTNALERVLCDADLLQCTEPDSGRWMVGLAAETGNIVNRETTAAFYKTATLHTAWGRSCLRAAGY